jgi:hypothetical protein
MHRARRVNGLPRPRSRDDREWVRPATTLAHLLVIPRQRAIVAVRGGGYLLSLGRNAGADVIMKGGGRI